MKDVIKEELDKMEAQGVIEPSNSPWASPVVLVKKKDGTVRFCIDYRKVNEITEKDAYPLPRIEDNLDSLKGARWFSTLDLASGYWQVEMAEEDKAKTAFCTKYGLFQFNVMPFGLCNAPGTFERLMETVLRGMQWERAVLYLDDIIVFSETVEEHLRRIEEILQRLKNANLVLKPSKCHFFKRQVEFLGHIVSQKGVETDPKKIKDVKEWPIPRRVRDVRSFLGLTGYYRRFIKDYGSIAKPLHELTEKTTAFIWTKARNEAFVKLKTALTSAPILGYPSAEKEDEFVLDTDASNCHIGAVLSQRQDGVEKVIAYGSKVLSPPERNYCVTRRELLAVVHFIVHFKHYLIGRHFQLRTDHGALTWLFSFKQPEGQIARWLEILSEYNFNITYRPGRIHSNCDGMSRRPCPDTCPTCKKGEISEEQAQKFRKIIPEELERGRQKCKGRTARMRTRTAKIRRTRNETSDQQWMKKIGTAQEEDVSLGQMEDWEDRPAWEEISAAGAELKIYWSRWNQIERREGIWYYLWKQEHKNKWKIIVPAAMREEIMEEHHDKAGHFGVMKTLEKLKMSPYYWPELRKSVEQWVEKCDICQRTKPALKKNLAPLGKYMAGEPMERIAIDVMGPLPETERGNKFIVVIGDYFTKWTEAYATKNHKAETIAKIVVEEFIGRFGIPGIIHTDQGRDFEGHLIRDMCKLLDIEKTRTTPWHPQSDGMIERFNRTLETLLRQSITEDQRNWDLQTPLCCMAYRASVHETTRKTPNYLMLGRELPMPSHLLVATPEQEKNKNMHQYVQKLEENMQSAHRVARENLGRGQRYQKKQYDKRAGAQKLKKGTLVWLFNPTKKVGRSPKLQIRWEEKPWQVVEIISDLVIRIEALDGKKKRVVHRNQLKEVKDQQKYDQQRLAVSDTLVQQQESGNSGSSPVYSLTTDGNGLPVPALL